MEVIEKNSQLYAPAAYPESKWPRYSMDRRLGGSRMRGTGENYDTFHNETTFRLFDSHFTAW
jgi:hypothetical protein